MTSNSINVIAGKNGCGKSQLLNMINSHHNTGNHNLKFLGYRNLFPVEKASISISGPTHIYMIGSSRTIAKDRDERLAGPYTFKQLENIKFSERYMKFRKLLSKLALEAECYSKSANCAENEQVQRSRKGALHRILTTFSELFPTLSLDIKVDKETQLVHVFACRSGMQFVRTADTELAEPLRFPFANLSDGELNTLFILYEIAYRSSLNSDPMLFLIDELENHLHPSLLSKFMRTLQTFLPAHTMILATTHSPQVIGSVFGNSRILMIHSSEMHSERLTNQLRVSSDDASAARILYDLYGAESADVAIHFLQDLGQAVAGEILVFAQESLRDAHAISTSSPADPQRTFLAGLVHARQAQGNPLVMLDVGAGQGRLIAGLRDDLRASMGPALEIDVVDPNRNYREALADLSQGEQGKAVLRHIFTSILDISSTNAYDYIMFANVMHEIPRGQLVKTIQCAIDLLKVGGAINVLEQAVLPQGEKYYFVFDGSALSGLFAEIGLLPTLSMRRSRSGIPIYELTATKSEHIVASRERLLVAVRSAVDRTIAKNIISYKGASDMPSRPVELAFHALNIANGELLKEALLAEA